MAVPLEVVFSDETAVIENLCSFISARANNCIESEGKFVMGVSGGSGAKYLLAGLPKQKTDWSKWHVFACDERHVPSNHPDSNMSLYLAGLGNLGIPKEQIYLVNTELPVSEAAEDYEHQIKKVLPGSVPRFHILSLGMGPDGHTCSLFPGHPLLKEMDRVVAPITDSPKPPPSRVTLTLPVLNASACCVFSACGEGKANMVQRVLQGRETDPLPAALVRPTDGEVYWYLDKAAASKLAKLPDSAAL